MDPEIADKLARSVLDDLASRPPNSRIIIGIAGVPGSGKTTLAAAVTARANAIFSVPTAASSSDPGRTSSSAPPIAVAIPVDGFHYTRAQLAAMPNAAEAVARRGAAFTFDADGFLDLIRRLAASPPAEDILAPSFAHEIKDPVADSIVVPASARVVVVEGNYCALDRKPWSDAARLMTRLWYVDAPSEVAQARLAIRHLEAGIVETEAVGWERARGSDERNAQDVRENLLKPDLIISGV